MANPVRMVFHPTVASGRVMTGLVALLGFELVKAAGSRQMVGGVYANPGGLGTGMVVPCDTNAAVLWGFLDLGIFASSTNSMRDCRYRVAASRVIPDHNVRNAKVVSSGITALPSNVYRGVVPLLSKTMRGTGSVAHENRRVLVRRIAGNRTPRL
jgi:hypothetical protein